MESGSTPGDQLLPELPFVRLAEEGGWHFWPSRDPGSAPDFLARKHEGEAWALALLEHYRVSSSPEMPPMLPRVLQYAFGHITPAAPDHFIGFVSVLDELLQFAARTCDLEAYSAALRYRQTHAREEWERHQPRDEEPA